MRDIPQSLNDKIKAAYQTISNNAEPHMDIFIGREADYLTALERFFVITIQPGQTLNRIDIAAARPDPYHLPTELTIVYLVDDDAYVATTPLPVHPKSKWTIQEALGKGIDVSIEFEGYWVRRERAKENFEDPRKSRFSLVTVGEPWYFVTRPDGSLEGKHGSGSWTTLVSDGVSRIDAIGGWKGLRVPHDDQGLVLAYIKSGVACYRNRATQEDLSIVWEAERVVAELPTGVDNLSLFRTNDYRTGFLAEVEGEIHWALTERTWSSMGIPDETFDQTPRIESISLTVHEIEHMELNPAEETFAQEPQLAALMVNMGSDEEMDTVVSIVSAKVEGEYSFSVTLSHPVYLWDEAGLLDGGLTSAYPFSNASYIGTKLTVTTSTPVEPLGFTATLSDYMLAGAVTPWCRRFVAGGSFAVDGLLGPQSVTFGQEPELEEVALNIHTVTQSTEGTPDETYDQEPEVEDVTLTLLVVGTDPI